MTFDEIVLHNFGPFKGRQVIQLDPPSKGKPVILVGGLNGAGKTTLLDGINLALYGRRAKCSKRGEGGYDDFLAASVHRGVSPHEGAGVELAFRRFEGGSEIRYRVRRTWSASTSTVRDRVEVLKNDVADLFLTESWNEQVEEFIPNGVANLFLFDGEKIERLADIERSKGMLHTALQSLLGLGLVEQLEEDLVALERRKRTLAKPSAEQQEIAELQSSLARLGERKTALKDTRASALVELEKAEKVVASVEEQLRSAGGELYAKRGQLEKDLDLARERLASVEEELRELASGALPLLLVNNELEALSFADRTASVGTWDPEVLPQLEARDEEVLARLKKEGLPSVLLQKLGGVLASDRDARRVASASHESTRLPAETRLRLRLFLSEGGEEARRGAERLQQTHHATQGDIVQLERYLAAMPHADTIDGLLARREKAFVAKAVATAKVRAIDAELEQADREFLSTQEVVGRKMEAHAEELNGQEDLQRTIAASSRTRGILKSFRAAMLARHTQRISRLVLDSYRQLLRKDSLVTDLVIDPSSLAVQLKGEDGEQLAPDRLSAGERQLLAVSMLWGLAQASGRPLPTVIDTPMGRLDSTHRDRLVERYFPRASHQVLLLSTDEEIKGGYLDKLQRFVGRTYRLIYNDKLKHTLIHDGYFW